MTTKWLPLLMALSVFACGRNNAPQTIDLTESWRFSSDPDNIGVTEKWHTKQLDDSQWAVLSAGQRWEDQGYAGLDGTAWYRKSVEIPPDWQGKDIWLKFAGVNDAYELFVNGKSVSFFGEANISFASKPSFSLISDYLEYGNTNLIAVKVSDWGNSGGLWRSPVLLTTDKSKVDNILGPLSPEQYTAESLGYELYWEDQFDGDQLDPEKWAVRGIGPRAAGYVSPEAVRVNNGFLELLALQRGDSIMVGAVGTQGRFMTKYGYFECRAQLQKSQGNWAAFWIQSTEIAKGEDPARYGVEIDIMEHFKKMGQDIVSHNIHWAYGPNQKTVGALESKREGVTEGFHTFAVEWTPEKYAFFIDGCKYHELTHPISHIEEYLILSMELPNSREDLKDAVFPDSFIVDYVKVFKRSAETPSGR
ncbi:MAG TPA: family 16 glycosylhydrolase [bacterium]|nr:family 16 glycosylhydrolase [bacterium]